MRFSYRSFLLLALPSPRPSFSSPFLFAGPSSMLPTFLLLSALFPCCNPPFCALPFLWACPSSVLQPSLLLPILLLCCRFCSWRGG